MIFHMIDQKANKWSGFLAVLVVVSLGTSWALKTPELSKKADELPKVEAQAAAVPMLKKNLAVVLCERGLARQAAGQAVAAANDNSVPLPDLAAVKHDGCPKAPPIALSQVSGMVAK